MLIQILKQYLKLYCNHNSNKKDKKIIITTNVDGQFEKSGFDKTRVFEVQGSYGKMQCSVGCYNKLYDNTELVKEMLKSKDNLRIDSNLVPKCPVCGRKMEINIRKDAFFVIHF